MGRACRAVYILAVEHRCHSPIILPELLDGRHNIEPELPVVDIVPDYKGILESKTWGNEQLTKTEA